MIISGKARANGAQLGKYLLTKGQNENISVLEVRGSASQDPKRAILEMSLKAELTKKGRDGLYHAHIAPAYGEDGLEPEQWTHAADVLEKALGYDGQNRVLVLHEKNGKRHLHIVWQREKDGKLIGDSHNYRKHDAAREQLERELGHKRTLQPGDVKHDLSQAYSQAKTGAEFIKLVKEKGYQVGHGERRAYTVQTPDGQKLDLVRQLKGHKTKDVREKLSDVQQSLPREAELVGQERLRDPQQKKRGRSAPKFAGEREIQAEQTPEHDGQTKQPSGREGEYYQEPQSYTIKEQGQTAPPPAEHTPDELEQRAAKFDELLRQFNEEKRQESFKRTLEGMKDNKPDNEDYVSRRLREAAERKERGRQKGGFSRDIDD